MNQYGKFYGIGVGPGAPDLLTIRAASILKSVHSICIPKSAADKESIALKVARTYIAPNTEIVEISTPMTRNKAVLEAEWQQGAEIIAERLKAGQDVAFITIGDAMLFSTYGYLLKKVRQLLPEVCVETVPGITSFSAAAAFINTPLAESNEKLIIIPALDDPAELGPILNEFPNAVLMKVAGRYPEILSKLTAMGLKDKAVYISKLGYSDQYITYDLDSVSESNRNYLSLIIVKQEGF